MFCSYWNRYWGYSFSFPLCNAFSKLCESCSFVFNSLQPYGLQPAKVLSPWNSSCQNTGVGSHFLLQGLPNPGIGHRSPELQADSLAAELSGKAFSKLIYGFIECLIHHQGIALLLVRIQFIDDVMIPCSWNSLMLVIFPITLKQLDLQNSGMAF